VTYSDLGTKECAFVDRDGRLIADGALCPLASGDEAAYMQGDFHDVTFAFVRARLARWYVRVGEWERVGESGRMEASGA